MEPTLDVPVLLCVEMVLCVEISRKVLENDVVVEKRSIVSSFQIYAFLQFLLTLRETHTENISCSSKSWVAFIISQFVSRIIQGILFLKRNTGDFVWFYITGRCL